VLAFWAKISEGARCKETGIPPSTFAFLPSVSSSLVFFVLSSLCLSPASPFSSSHVCFCSFLCFVPLFSPAPFLLFVRAPYFPCSALPFIEIKPLAHKPVLPSQDCYSIHKRDRGCRTCAASRRKHPPSNSILCGKSEKYGETRNSCLLLVEKWNGSRHLVFWSLGTLTGLRGRIRGLVA